MDLDKLEAELSVDEGRENKMYLDSLSIPSIGVGHNLRDKPISDAAVSQIFKDDIADTLANLARYIPWYTQLSEARQRVLANMAYNMGIHGLLQFVKMLNAAQAGAFELAAREMESSLWFRQVGARGKRLARMMREG